ncbi:MAG: acetyl-CoA decarbonylase/synthase complex subunit delta [Proteobacteria bacterium]|jgi:acetyl-CoA decarbonylase/synthase complex subunit delta|nr:acetyl-CoA decarbonylase/synthase complex subunit delta [Pseudomonadota bacterium]
MALEIAKQQYTGKIREITLGKGAKAVKVGGETAYPFYLFEGQMPNPPKIALQVWDIKPEEWAAAAIEPFKDVAGDPVAWAKKCIDVYKADLVALQLVSTDPNGMNRGADEAATTVKKVADAIDCPLIVWGVNNVEKDMEVLRKVAEVCEGKSLIIGPVTEGNYKQIGATAIGYQHTVIASTPIDINLAKQLNILLGNLGVSDERLIVDPTTGGLGYGLEYTFSVIERLRMAALTQQDDKLQFPIVCNLAEEVWKTKEAKTGDDAKLGNANKRGILMESITAVTLLMAGADILIMRHPESMERVRNIIKELLG